MFSLRKRFSQFNFPYLARILFFILIFSGIWLMFTLSLRFQQPASSYIQSKLTRYLITLLWYRLATSSKVGANILQGPHHSAQKSTITGMLLSITLCSKSLSETENTLFIFFYPKIEISHRGMLRLS